MPKLAFNMSKLLRNTGQISAKHSVCCQRLLWTPDKMQDCDPFKLTKKCNKLSINLYCASCIKTNKQQPVQ